MQKQGVAAFLLYSSITFTLRVGNIKFLLLHFILQSFDLAMQDSDPSFYSTKTLINSGSVQKILTTLLKLVQNTQKTTQTNLFEYQGKMFLNIETVLIKVSEKQS